MWSGKHLNLHPVPGKNLHENWSQISYLEGCSLERHVHDGADNMEFLYHHHHPQMRKIISALAGVV